MYDLAFGKISEGIFKAENGKLYRSVGLDDEIDENKYDTYEISENKLKLIEPFGEDAENADVGMDLYPATFKRVS